MLWENLRQEQFADAVRETEGLCIMPIGCFEMHGQHLPSATDCFEAEAVAKMASELESACVFPTFRFGDVTGLVNYRGAICLQPKLMLDLLENLCSEISRNGFKKILITNHHGGNVPLLSFFERSLFYTKKDYTVLVRNDDYGVSTKLLGERLLKEGSGLYPELLPEDERVLIHIYENNVPDGHGGVNETSLMLALRPETVAMDRIHAVDGYSNGKADKLKDAGMYQAGSIWAANHPFNYSGDAEGASERIGRLLLRLQAEGLAKACRIFKDDTSVPEWRAQHDKYYPKDKGGSCEL